MYIRIYRNPVICCPIQRSFIADVDSISKRYVEIKGSDDYLQWYQTWYICAKAFVMYYATNEKEGLAAWQRVHKKTWAGGWPEYELLTIGSHRFHVVHTQTREETSYGSMLSARLSKSIFDRSKGTHFVMAAYDAPDVDIVGWLPREEMVKCQQRGAYYLKEPILHPMSECPSLSTRDNKKWYI